MKAGKDWLDIITKMDVVKSLITKDIGEFTNQEIQSMLCHCWYYKFGRKKELTNKEHEVLDLLLKNKKFEEIS